MKDAGTKRILMVSRAVVPPWDEASKNLVSYITDRLDKYQFHILTTKEVEGQKGNVVTEKIYRNKSSGLSQKLRLFWYLISNRSDFDLYHFCFTPEYLTVLLVELIIKKNKIWSIPYISSRTEKSVKRLTQGNKMLTVTSEYTRKMLEREGIYNVEVVYPGVDTIKFNPIKRDEGLKAKFHLTGRFNVLHASNITNDVIADAVESIIKKTTQLEGDINFVIACRKDQPSDIRRKRSLKERFDKAGLKNRVSMLGTVEDMSLLFAACDIFIYPYFDNFEKKIDIPYVIIEAMASGLPILISNKRPLNEVIRDGAGVVIKNDSTDEFAEVIVSLFKDRESANKLGIENRRAAEQYFDIHKMVEKFDSLYHKILFT